MVALTFTTRKPQMNSMVSGAEDDERFSSWLERNEDWFEDELNKSDEMMDERDVRTDPTI